MTDAVQREVEMWLDGLLRVLPAPPTVQDVVDMIAARWPGGRVRARERLKMATAMPATAAIRFGFLLRPDQAGDAKLLDELRRART